MTWGYGDYGAGFGYGDGGGSAEPPPWTPLDLFAEGENGAWLPTQLGHMWKNTNGTDAVAAADDAIGRIDDQSGNGNHMTQSSGSLRPLYKAGGFRQYDGIDDRMLGVLPCAAANSLAVKVTAPIAAVGTHCFAGVRDNATTGYFFIGMNITGFLSGGVGTQNNAIIVGTTDIRGQTGVGELVADGSTVRLLWSGNVEYEAAQVGAFNTVDGLAEGARNNHGSLTNFTSAAIWDRIFLRRAFTEDEEQALVDYWMAA